MGYFDDLTFVHARIIPHCPVVVDKRFPSICSVEFMLAGRLSYAVDDGPAQVLTQPTLFWHHPRHTYQYGPADDEGWHHHYATMSGPRARRLVEEGFMPLCGKGFLPVSDGPAFAALFRVIAEIVEDAIPARQGEAVIAMEQILCLAQAQSCRTAQPTAHEHTIAAVAQALMQEPLRRYDFQREAASLNLSYSHFRRLFAAQTGRAPHDYLLLCRMRHAARLLTDPARQIKDIARVCGYDDPAAFSRVFRQQLGLPPKQYRATIPTVARHHDLPAKG